MGDVSPTELTCSSLNKFWKNIKMIHIFLSSFMMKWHVSCSVRKNKISALKNIYFCYSIFVTVFFYTEQHKYHFTTKLRTYVENFYMFVTLFWNVLLFIFIHIYARACELWSQSEFSSSNVLHTRTGKQTETNTFKSKVNWCLEIWCFSKKHRNSIFEFIFFMKIGFC